MASTLPTPNSCCSLCSGLTVTIDTGTGVGGTSGTFVVETLLELRALIPSTSNNYAVLLGDTVKYDFGPAKSYYWDATSVEADAPFSIVVPDNDTGTGRWIEVT